MYIINYIEIAENFFLRGWNDRNYGMFEKIIDPKYHPEWILMKEIIYFVYTIFLGAINCTLRQDDATTIPSHLFQNILRLLFFYDRLFKTHIFEVVPLLLVRKPVCVKRVKCIGPFHTIEWIDRFSAYMI